MLPLTMVVGCITALEPFTAHNAIIKITIFFFILSLLPVFEN
jgi:hypothetical protein